jgi:uncharacterized protein
MSFGDSTHALSDPLTKFQGLVRSLASYDGVAVAFSGGVDSSLVLYAAKEALRDRVVAFIGISPLFPHRELEQARIVAHAIGTELVEVECDILDVEKVVANGPDRCYHCKRTILGHIKELARERGLEQVVDGNNADDVETGRQGIKAVVETGTRSPLAEVGLTKGDIRELAMLFGLPSADKPSSACLASRIPFGEPLTLKNLEQVDRAEERLRDLGIGQMRVRHHGQIARVEVGLMDISMVLLHREEIVNALKEIGFTYVTLDLEGFRSGSMEEVVPQPARTDQV